MELSVVVLTFSKISIIVRLPRTEPTRLKLHRQIEVRSDTDLSVSMNINTVEGCEEDISFDLHYFELACPEACAEGERFVSNSMYVPMLMTRD